VSYYVEEAYMKVYLVSYPGYDREIVGIFLTREKAEAAALEVCGALKKDLWLYVTEFTLDEVTE
jgi:hypothetical protein